MRFQLVKNTSDAILATNLAATIINTTASTSFDIMRRASKACRSDQMEVKKIGKRVNGINYQDTVSGVKPVIEKENSLEDNGVKHTKLSSFGVYSYIERGKVHKECGETIHKSSLPLYTLLYEEGYGKVVGVTIDNVGLESILISDKMELGNGTPKDIACQQILIFDDSVIKELDNGFHEVIIFAADSRGKVVSDYFAFNLAD